MNGQTHGNQCGFHPLVQPAEAGLARGARRRSFQDSPRDRSARAEAPSRPGDQWLRWAKHLRAFAREPRRMGSIAPSSRRLAEALIGRTDLGRANLVVELGPGTGAITAIILPRLGSATKFMAMEIDPICVAELRRRFPGVCIHAASAVDLVDFVRPSGSGRFADCVIACLPWAGTPDAVQTAILTAVWDCLAPEGCFRFFNYVHARCLPSSCRFHRLLRRSFRSCVAETVVWANLPPAIVYHCTGKASRPTVVPGS